VADYARPQTLTEALRLLAAGPGRVLAGGTDLYPAAAARLAGPIIDLAAVAELSGLQSGRQSGLRIGALTPWTTLAEAKLPPALRALQQAARQVGGRQVQNAGTIGGNLCNASPAADSVPALIAAGATCLVAGPDGEREVPVAEIPGGPGRTTLRAGEFVVELRLPARPAGGGDAYLRATPRTEMDIAVVGMGVNLTLEGGVVKAARVGLGAVAPTVLLVEDAGKALVGSRLEDAALEAAAAACRAACNPINDKRGTIAYRIKVAGVLLKRTAAIAAQRAGGN